MAASFFTSPRGFGALLALLAAGAALSGCASMTETVAPAFADPAKYELYDCKQLEAERKALWDRFKHLFSGDSKTLVDAVVDHCAVITLGRIKRGELSLLPSYI